LQKRGEEHGSEGSALSGIRLRRPPLTQLGETRHHLAAQALPKSPLGDALRYLDNQWGALQRYVEDGRLAIDNNRAYCCARYKRGNAACPNMPRRRADAPGY
jgi:hypothetical protein